MQPVMPGKNPHYDASIRPLEGTPPQLRIQLLGEFKVWVRGERISEEALHSRRVRNLIKLLALNTSHRLHRDQIIDTLWPDSDLSAAANNFHQTLHAARKELCPDGPACLLLREGILILLEGQSPEVDIDRFEAVAEPLLKMNASPEDYQEALRLYSGDLLPDDLYEEWTILRRTTLRETYLRLLAQCSAEYERRQEYGQGIKILKTLLGADPSDEDAHASLMRLYALNGQRRDALKQYDLLTERLRRELDVEPSESTKKLRQEVHSGLVGPQPPLVIPHSNLPVELTSFVGREQEVAALKGLVLSGKSRLVTVTGAGGVGKTRLALRAAQELLEAYPQGVWFVDLAPLSDPSLVAVTAAKKLGLLESTDQSPTQVLAQFLREKRVLLLLDNCEHVIESAAGLAETLLINCPRIVILATSRELLRVNGETTFRCPSLRLPETEIRAGLEEPSNWQTQASCESLLLFAERAALVDPGFRVDEQNIHPISQICRQLDGIPLAIEMAAARLYLLSLEQIAARLSHVFQLLNGGLRTELPRHRTLRAMIDWSFDLLPENEQRLLCRLSVFMGGWTLEAAEWVGVDGVDIHREDVLDLLGQLQAKSLVQVEPAQNPDTRYRMLEPVRQYAFEHLVQTEGVADTRRRHLDYYTDLADRAEPHLRAWGMVEWLERLEQELGNLRLALDWSLAGPMEYGMRIATALLWFWFIRYHRIEGISWLERLLAEEERKFNIEIRTEENWITRARMLLASAILKYRTDAPENEPEQLVRQSKQIFLKFGDTYSNEIATCNYYSPETYEEIVARLEVSKEVANHLISSGYLQTLAYSKLFAGDLDESQDYSDQNIALCRQIGDLHGEGFAFNQLCDLAVRRGDVDKIQSSAHSAEVCFQLIGNHDFMINASMIPCRAMILQGEYEQARRLILEKSALVREMAGNAVNGLAQIWMTQVCCFLGEYDEAERWCTEFTEKRNSVSVDYLFGRIALSRGDWALASSYLKTDQCLHGAFRLLAVRMLGVIAVAENRTRRAAQLFGALDRWCCWLSRASAPIERTEYDQALARAREVLGEDAFQAAWEEGRAMTRDQMMAYAQEGVESG